MKNRRILSVLLAVLLLFSLSAPLCESAPSLARAVTQAEIDALREDADDLSAEIDEIEDELAKIRSDKSQMVQQVSLLSQQVSSLNDEIAYTEDLISGYDALLAQTAWELEENEKDEEAQYALFCERARVMEESGSTSYWSVLFKSDSFSDLLSRLSDVQEVINYDQSVLDGLRQLRTQIREKQAYQEQLKAESEETKAALETRKADAQAKQEEAQALLAEIEADEAASEELMRQKEAEDARIQKEIEAKEEELERQNALPEGTAGGYIWPESVSKRITSPMGSRNTGIAGASTNHKGVDIGGVGYTTTVVAAKAGVVITSAKSSSYGNYVVISHGKGNTTLYAHMSSRLVSEGDYVSQGQAIGVTGSTGITSGPHLHYEITEGGVRVDPLNYLPGYIQAW